MRRWYDADDPHRRYGVPIAFHHIHLYLPGDEHLAAEAWYVRMFGGVGGKRSNLFSICEAARHDSHHRPAGRSSSSMNSTAGTASAKAPVHSAFVLTHGRKRAILID
jgi:hypothetical protein